MNSKLEMKAVDGPRQKRPAFGSRESVVSSVRMMTVWSWLKKLGGVLRVPRPRHPGNDPEAAEKFK
jgi:hypothetical protein